MLMMIPPLIGLKGNIEMSFSSRISAIVSRFFLFYAYFQANTIAKGIQLLSLFHLITSNFILGFVRIALD